MWPMRLGGDYTDGGGFVPGVLRLQSDVLKLEGEEDDEAELAPVGEVVAAGRVGDGRRDVEPREADPSLGDGGVGARVDDATVGAR